ncbi:hypothetical protein DY000_02007617 [Brassica cretica]|uniref:Uncharacterized protein n=1 Tax=Brassica cretica TaxID=69181 RepID=A0ABQ7BZY2_BRACR|nr:hypothetical protein DY000_02007617 [Brassica cretica]
MPPASPIEDRGTAIPIEDRDRTIPEHLRLCGVIVKGLPMSLMWRKKLVQPNTTLLLGTGCKASDRRLEETSFEWIFWVTELCFVTWKVFSKPVVTLPDLAEEGRSGISWRHLTGRNNFLVEQSLSFRRVGAFLRGSKAYATDFRVGVGEKYPSIISSRLQAGPRPPEVQSLKEKLDEHSKQLEQSAEKLSQLQSENTVLRDQNQARNTAGNKKRRFNTQVRPMGNLNTPNSREDATDPAPASCVAGATREGAENPRVHNLEESDSEPEYDKETPEKISAT